MKSLFAAAAFLATALTASAQEGKPPSIHFGAHDAAVSGVTPNGHVVLLGVGVQPGGLYVSQFKWVGVLDSDQKGDATVDFGFAVPQSTIWGVIDIRNGQAAVVTPSGRPVPQEHVRPHAFRKKDAIVAEFAFKHPVLDLVYVDSGGGVWSGAVSDGASTDRDGPNGVSTISVDDFQPLGTTSGKPAELKPGGRLIAIDGIRMEAISLRLDAAMLGAAQ
jgi:hypothetical protein